MSIFESHKQYENELMKNKEIKATGVNTFLTRRIEK